MDPESNQTTNPYSEISEPACFGPNAAGGYQTPASLKEELGQLIESRRKRTLMLLRAKEAPRASVELTSPTAEEPPPPPEGLQSLPATPTPGLEGRPRSATPTLSDYENLSHHNLQSGRLLAEVCQQPEPQPQPQPEPEDLQPVGVSPSESQNLNTLSLASDVLADLSQEDHSIVQQLAGEG